MTSLKKQIQTLVEKSAFTAEDREVYEEFKTALRRGEHVGEAGNFARVSDGQDGRDVQADRDAAVF